MPRGFETEAGPLLEFARLYVAVEIDGGYRERTQANACDSDATVWFGVPTSPGFRTTLRACQALGRPVLIVEAGITRLSDLTTWLVAGFVEDLTVESSGLL